MPVSGTPQQESIWRMFRGSSRHLEIAALAGTGKTFTVLEGLRRIKRPAGPVAFVAFNRSIAQELKGKVPSWVEASTFHSLMLRLYRDSGVRVRVDADKMEKIGEKVLGPRWKRLGFVERNAILKAAGLCKNTLRWPDEQSVEMLADRYDISFNGMGSGEAADILERMLDECARQRDVVDFDDMLWLPVHLNVSLPRFGLLAVDEAQDLNAVQQAALLRLADRAVFVGDEHQAIYGFRGADVESMRNLATSLGGTDRGLDVGELTLTRRCPKSHVAMARQIVPALEALPDAPEGEIEYTDYAGSLDAVQPGDLVVCRTNAPVVQMAFGLLRRGVPATIQGRDLGQGLQTLIRKLCPSSGPGSVATLLRELDRYESKEREKLMKFRRSSGSRLVALEDKCQCIRELTEGLDDVTGVIERIKSLFEDHDGTPRKKVLLSTVHRAKGLEATHVLVLGPEMMPHPMAQQDWERVQEQNIRYVALTRSKQKMTFASLTAR